jgi:hypothetical protein
MDLGFGRPIPTRGKPKYAEAALGEYIIRHISDRSRPYGTQIHYLSGENTGVIDFD